MNKAYLRVLIFCLGIAFSAGCGLTSPEVAEPAGGGAKTENAPARAEAEAEVPAPVMEKIADPGPLFTNDDLSAESLRKAVAHSMRYFNKLPADTRFDYGGTEYTVAEVKESMELFTRLLSFWDDRQRFAEELKAKFDFYRSPGDEETGEVLFTAYFEPVLNASSAKTSKHVHPAYAPPSDLRVLDLGEFRPGLANKTIVYRAADGEILPYPDRREIMANKALRGKAKELVWFSNPLDLFFLQIQGSGIVKLEDGTQMRLGYAGSNGRKYFSIGRLLVAEEKIPLERVSMQSIRSYLEAHPDEIERVMYSNPSYTFFQLQSMEEGPFGSINVPLTPERSLATDYQIFPKGALTFAETEVVVCGSDGNCGQTRPIKRFMLNQDTGGAIRGFGRADLFMGRGAQAGERAGRQKSKGKLWFLIAKKEHLAPGKQVYSLITPTQAAKAH